MIGSLAFAGDNGTIYLTFDDGPNDATLNVLEVLNEQDVKATFFINPFHLEGIGDENESKALEALKLTLNTGHLVGNHSYDHMLHNCCDGNECGAKVCNRIGRWNVDSYQDVEKDKAYFDLAVKKTNGIWPKAIEYKNYQPEKYYRLPYINNWRLDDDFIGNAPCATKDSDGWCSPEKPSKSSKVAMLIADELYNQGGLVYGWDIDWWSPINVSHKLVARQTISQMEQCESSLLDFPCDHKKRENKVILLLHDFHFEDGKRGPGKRKGAKELKKYIVAMKKQGYQFDTLDNY